MAGSNAVAVRPPSASVDEVRKALLRDDRQEQLVALLGDSIDPDRFRAVVLNTMVRNADLQQASLESVLDAIRVSATLKLEPTGILGEGYILKYGSTAQFEAGYRGLMKLARRSGQVSAMDAQVVYANDPFDIQLGTEPRIDHRPTVEGERGAYRGVYAWARLTTGELVIEWMTEADVQAVRKVSRNGSGPSSPWVNHYGEMARKTVIKRLMKRLPLGADAEYALRHEAEQEATQEPVRRPSAAITSIHQRLGIPATTAAGTDPAPAGEPVHVAAGGTTPADHAPDPARTIAAASGAPDTTDPAPVEGEGAPVPASSPEPAQCDSLSPYDNPTQCQREAGHGGTHKNRDRESW